VVAAVEAVAELEVPVHALDESYKYSWYVLVAVLVSLK